MSLTKGNIQAEGRVIAGLATNTPDWQTGQDYIVNDEIYESGSLYRCNTSHTASAAFATDSANWDAVGVGGGGIADGDKGDITVSGGGATFTIDNGVVTNAKSADVATATIKGRSAAGTGVLEDLSAAQVIAILGLNNVATSGDYNDLSNTPDLSTLDNVDQFANLAAFPGTGVNDVIYIANDTGLAYRWNGTAYVTISSQPITEIPLWVNNTGGGSYTANISIINYNGELYKNTTGINTDTAPDTDTTNWTPLITGGGGGSSIINVANRAALLAQTTGDYFYVEDGNDGGFFALYSGATAADGGVIIELTDLRKVKRLDPCNSVHVDWFGDGRTSANIQSAIDYAVTNDIKYINFSSKGKYVISGINVANVSDLTLSGDGARIEIEDGTGYLFSITSSQDVTFKGFHVVGDNIYGNTTYNAVNLHRLVYASGCARLKIVRNTFSKFTSQAIYVENANDNGLSAQGSIIQHGAFIFDNKFFDQPYDAAAPEQAAIILASEAEYSNVMLNEFYTVPSAIRFTDGANSTFAFNQIEDILGDATLREDRAAIFAVPNANSFKLKINNNRINHTLANKYAILLDGDGFSVIGNPSEITDNTILAHGASSQNAESIKVVNNSHTRISGNTLRSQGNTNGYEITIKDSDFVTVTENTLVAYSSPVNALGILLDNCQDVLFSNNNIDNSFITEGYSAINGTTFAGNYDVLFKKRKTVLDVSMLNNGSQIANVKVNGQDVVTANMTNVTDVTEAGGVFTCNHAPFAWASGFSSSLYMDEGEDCSVEFEAVNTTSYTTLGLSYTDADLNWTSIDYAIYMLNNGTLQEVTNGVRQGTIGTYVAGDIFKVMVKGTDVHFLKNGEILAISDLKIQTDY